MAKSYTELEAWGIFIGALVIGIVLTSVFWAIITVPEDEKRIEQEIKAAEKDNVTFVMQEPRDFITFCQKVDGSYRWDNEGLRECTINDASEKSLIAMRVLCNKFNLSLSYGSYGVRCEGTVIN